MADNQEESKNEIERMKRVYEEELQRKDRIIEELRREREVLIRTAMREAERNVVVKQRVSFHRKNQE